MRTILLVGAICMSSVARGDIVPPTERGPYNVGTTLFTATMSGGRVARVQAFYPTSAAVDPSSAYTVVTPVGSYHVRSLYGAAMDAVAVPGRFPLVAWDHGGTAPGGDSQRVSLLAVHELMATHGLVTFLALHSGNRAARARDLPLLIDLALARSASAGDLLHDSIDPGRIGIGGFSAGGETAISVAAGWAAPIDARIRAMLVYEPGFTAPVADVTAINVPYLLLRGTQIDHFTGGIPAQPAFDDLFATSVLASPRIQVLTPNALHFSHFTGLCDIIEQAREQALLANPAMPEPLTTLTASSAAAAAAYTFWNMGQSQYPNNGAGFGGGRNVCYHVGVDSIRSLDADGDGETDSPPLLPVDPPYAPVAAPRQEVMVHHVAHYSVAFWKVFLEGDGRYMRYLTPGYAKVHGLLGQVTITE